ncbi:ABC transporter ATP-binding protein/permease [Clostridium estertheticum]|uniref:ABC transporter ATP-binding protein/permease n=1 Tax=Clostridium estertheticum TaxID=238834 RepID=A0AA47I5D0_9CLOT|nr:ABC transporter ATP-binding protein [Clostridium estertheticum]MBU3156125.1 ABC transporter ATP-binding protein/permease [Clostridium estertheticum]MBU3199356.1 ABC transporter ATP-binding protein/permease [Clostridium estertheticum]WAG58565.1 ABC transporter ATP-binding protein/permease [Clostridium estertheticum]WAG67399.1 ABC transporter ATP-binding protein/permease [Clostridium estertheticum]
MDDINGHDLEFETLLKEQNIYKNKPVKTLAYLYKDNISKLLLSFLFFIIKHLPTWVMPIITANVIDIVSSPARHNLKGLWINLIIASLLIIQNVPSNILYTKYFSQALRCVEAELRSKLVRKLQILSISYHKQLKSGKIQSKVLRDVEAITVLSRQIFNGFVPTILNIVVALTITLTKSFTVAIFFMLSMPVSFFIIKHFRKNIRKTNRDFRKEIEEMSANVAEMVELVPITRAHGLENVEITRMDKQLEKVRHSGYNLDIITAFLGASGWAVFQVFQVGCLAFTGYLAYRGKITVGDVVLYQSYFSSILNQVSSLINVYPDIVKGFESIESVGEILLSEDIEDNKGKKKIINVKGDFDFKGVEFNYETSEKPVLKDFNLKVNAGECIAFVGESGAGKTTILNLIIGFNKASKGKLLIDGMDMAEIDLRSYRSNIAVVPQNTILFSGTIRSNITYGLTNIREEEITKVIESANLTEVIAKLPKGLNTSIGEHGGMLSGGQRQRIAIARALIRNPQIIVLDEATSALDNISELHVQKAMKNLVKDRTTFIVAHRLSTIRDADRIVVMNNGRCVECGTYAELINLKGEFYNLKKLQG